MAMHSPKLLLVDGDRLYVAQMSRLLRSLGFQIWTAHTSASASEELRSTAFDYAVIDLKLDDENGLSVLKNLSQHQQNCTVIIVTSYASLATAVAAIQMGARDYLVKPATPEQIKGALLGRPENKVKIDTHALRTQHVLFGVQF